MAFLSSLYGNASSSGYSERNWSTSACGLLVWLHRNASVGTPSLGRFGPPRTPAGPSPGSLRPRSRAHEGGLVLLGGNQRPLFFLRFPLHSNHQVRRPALGHQKGVDPAARTNQRDIGPDTFGQRLDVGEVGRTTQVPVAGIAHHEVQDLLLRTAEPAPWCAGPGSGPR